MSSGKTLPVVIQERWHTAQIHHRPDVLGPGLSVREIDEIIQQCETLVSAMVFWSSDPMITLITIGHTPNFRVPIQSPTIFPNVTPVVFQYKKANGFHIASAINWTAGLVQHRIFIHLILLKSAHLSVFLPEKLHKYMVIYSVLVSIGFKVWLSKRADTRGNLLCKHLPFMGTPEVTCQMHPWIFEYW